MLSERANTILLNHLAEQMDDLQEKCSQLEDQLEKWKGTAAARADKVSLQAIEIANQKQLIEQLLSQLEAKKEKQRNVEPGFWDYFWSEFDRREMQRARKASL